MTQIMIQLGKVMFKTPKRKSIGGFGLKQMMKVFMTQVNLSTVIRMTMTRELATTKGPTTLPKNVFLTL